MSKIVSEKQINAFVKGLITEASPLTYPENASLDEDNFDLELNGSRSRRLGVDYESGYQLNATGLDSGLLSAGRQSSHRWDSPGGSTSVVLGVIRIYNKLWFINLLAANPSADVKNGGSPIIIGGLANSDIETTVINNFFVIVSKDLPKPVVLSYNPTTDTITKETLSLTVRDIWGVHDALAINERPLILSNTHKYNLRNQGWDSKITSTCAGSTTTATTGSVMGGFFTVVLGNIVAKSVTTTVPNVDAIDCTFSTIGKYPSNSDLWTLGKIGVTTDANYQKYDPTKLVLNSIDSNSVSKGSYILDIFNRGESRSLVSGITSGGSSGLPVDVETGTFTTVASYASRVFYSGVSSSVTNGDVKSPNYSNYIFFSQVVTSKDKLGRCHQEADPTSPNISDIVDTDGGSIQIPEASKILKIINSRSSLLVFAENGIWEIYGDTGGFKATSFQASRISAIGITNPRTVIDANGTVIFWSKAGIFILTQDKTTGRLSPENISLTTIQTYYNNIPELAKKNARGFYDETHNHIRWLYNSNTDYSETNYITTYNKEINFDIALQAFYLTTISPLATNSPKICDYISIPYSSLTIGNDAILVGTDPVIITAGSDPVVIPINTYTSRSATYCFLTLSGTSFTLSRYSNTTFFDWVSADGVGVNYSSFLVTGYELNKDILRKKQVPYILFYFDKTENGFEFVNGNLELAHKSGCVVQAQWNWANSAASGKWGVSFQAYRFLRDYIPTGVTDPFDYGDRVIVTKNKLRGSGKCLSLKIQSESGKDMKLLGWAEKYTGGSEP